LWMGDIDPWMDDECIRQVWACVGENVAVKMIRDRLTGGPANYCFIEVPTQADAERILSLYNAQPMPAPFARSFRLNWASGMPLGFNSALVPTAATASSPISLVPLVDAPEFSLFVGDLASEVTDIQLANEFRCRYASVRTAKVVTDPITNLPRGYGFVRFSDEADQQRALAEMQGKIIGSRAIRVSTATPKRTPTGTANYTLQQGDSASRDVAGSPASSTSSASSNALYNPATDPFNTTVFVGGLMHPVGEDELHAFFAVYGEVVYCKIPPNRGCGFVTFAKRANAETAMRALNGHTLGGSRIRLSWGRSQSHARHNHHRH
ncbi:RNA-binding domain-containing protein, partial [Martensiomyces pterosporus]